MAYPISPTSDRAYVRALYRAVLNREPDGSGFRGHYRELKEGKLTRAQLLKVFLCSSEFKKKHSNEHVVCH